MYIMYILSYINNVLNIIEFRAQHNTISFLVIYILSYKNHITIKYI